MTKQEIQTVWMKVARVAVLGAWTMGSAHAAGLPAAAGAGYGVPTELSMLLWVPLLLLTASCVIALLWMIRADARRERALTGPIRPRHGFYLPGRRVAHLHH